MKNFTFIKTNIEDLIIIKTNIFEDTRGYFMETYNRRDLEKAGIKADFVQDNQSKSKKGVLRGLHFQVKNPQGKLVRVTRGEVFDVAVDLRPKSKEFVYKCTNFYDKESESGIIWNDPDLKINWPIKNLGKIILSDKDKMHQTFLRFKNKLY